MPSDWPFVSYYFSRSAVFQRLLLERRADASWGRGKASQTLISGECNSYLLMLTLMMEMIQLKIDGEDDANMAKLSASQHSRGKVVVIFSLEY